MTWTGRCTAHRNKVPGSHNKEFVEIILNNHVAFAATGREDLDPRLPTVIFIHGAGLDHTVWTLFNRYHARNKFNSIAVDLPGHRRSGGNPRPSIEASARWLLEFIHSLGIEKAALVGHSMGALVALETAYQAQPTISRLALLGAAIPMTVADPLLNAARANDHSAVDMIMLYSHAYISQLGGNPVAGIHILNSNMRLLERNLENVLYADLRACHEYNNGLAAARNISVPVTLILGEEDRMTPPAQAADLINALAQVQVEILPDCGHMMLSEQPEAVHRVLARVLSIASPP